MTAPWIRRRFAPRRRHDFRYYVRRVWELIKRAFWGIVHLVGVPSIVRWADPRRIVHRWRTAWSRWPSQGTIWTWVLNVLGTASVVVGLLSLWSYIEGRDQGPVVRWLSDSCKATGFGCQVASNLVFTAAPLLIGFLLFLGPRNNRLRRTYVRYARKHPTELVQTAGSIAGQVVGRDDLCDILQDDLRKRRSRQPHVLVGGLGIGKTAVLVQLTKLLAERGAVPVPIRLRDAEDRIDFLGLARERFADQLGYRFRSEAEAERVWRWLRKQDKLVVLADGLEEAFADEDSRHDRDHRVRVAVREAAEQRFPLIIASRPHQALRAIAAAQVHLEPLSEEVALEYIEGAELQIDEPRLHWVVETADVTDTPLYLQLARELHRAGLLEHHYVDTRGADRVPLRLRLMKAWLDAMALGKLKDTKDVPLAKRQRDATVMHLEVLACIALRDDTQQILFDDYTSEPKDDERPAGADDPSSDSSQQTAAEKKHEREVAKREIIKAFTEELRSKLPQLRSDGDPTSEVYDMQAAASRGIQLKLVDHVTRGVRFPHSIMQAYLGSRVMQTVLSKPDFHYLRHGLEKPSREFLLALVMYARSSGLDEDKTAQGDARRRNLLCRLLNAEVHGSKRLDVLAAAIQIGMAIELDQRDQSPPSDGSAAPGHAREGPASKLAFDAAKELAGYWKDVTTPDDTTREAKLNAIDRLGDAARLLPRELPEPPEEVPGPKPPTEAAEKQRADVAACRAEKFANRKDLPGLYASLYEICLAEQLYPIRLAAAQQIGKGGDYAWEEVRSEFDTDLPEGRSWKTEWRATLTRTGKKREREYVLQGWLLPMLVGSIETDWRREEALADLRRWIDLAGAPEEDGPMTLALEAALAQGFKHTANRRPHYSNDHAESRAELQHLAVRLIHRARFWYSRIALLHALCLLELARIEFPGNHGDGPTEAQQDPEGLVERWLRHTGRDERPEHPFVLQAADLVLAALKRRQPERFIWIDESGVVGKIGSRSRLHAPHGLRSLWIPPSAGWIALHRRTQQLVADVQILLNLAERGGLAREREEGLEKTNADGLLPLCLTRDRCAHLKPSQTVGMADFPHPGEECRRHCRVLLCPYPPRGQQQYRGELSEALCRHQLAMTRMPRPRPRWSEAPRRELRKFWKEMEARARK